MLLSTLSALAAPQVAAQAPAAPRTEVALTAKSPARGATLAWSPKGAKVELSKDGAALVGAFPLGPKGTPPLAVRLERSQPDAAHFDTLSIDLDRNGTFAATERLVAVPKDQRGKWWSSFEATALVPFAAEGALKARTVPYPMSLWFVEDPQEPTAPPMLRWSRRGWHEGTVTLDGKPAIVLITEMEMDGVFTSADSWALATDRKLLLSSGSRALSGHSWLEERAFRVVELAADGSRIVIEPFDPRTTEAAEKAKADLYKPDREAKRAAQPLAFGADFAAALAKAAPSKQRVLVDFATSWCGPCKLMDQLVYTAADVVAAAKDVVAVKLDGDVERELVKRFGITAYPTMLLLEADGTEVRRVVGYQGVAAMQKFLAK